MNIKKKSNPKDQNKNYNTNISVFKSQERDKPSNNTLQDSSTSPKSIIQNKYTNLNTSKSPLHNTSGEKGARENFQTWFVPESLRSDVPEANPLVQSKSPDAEKRKKDHEDSINNFKSNSPNISPNKENNINAKSVNLYEQDNRASRISYVSANDIFENTNQNFGNQPYATIEKSNNVKVNDQVMKKYTERVSVLYSRAKGEGNLINSSVQILNEIESEKSLKRKKKGEKTQLSTILLSKNIDLFDTRSPKIQETPKDTSFNQIPAHSNRFMKMTLAFMAGKLPKGIDKAISRDMRVDKGGVVDFNSRKNQQKRAYQIKKVTSSRSPSGKNKTTQVTFKEKEKSAKIIQSWWRGFFSKFKATNNKLVLIQKVYRGHLVRNYMDDLYRRILETQIKKVKVLQKAVRKFLQELRNGSRKNVLKLKNAQKKKSQKFDKALNNSKKFHLMRIKHYFRKWKDYAEEVSKLLRRVFFKWYSKSMKIKKQENETILEVPDLENEETEKKGDIHYEKPKKIEDNQKDKRPEFEKNKVANQDKDNEKGVDTKKDQPNVENKEKDNQNKNIPKNQDKNLIKDKTRDNELRKNNSDKSPDKNLNTERTRDNDLKNKNNEKNPNKEKPKENELQNKINNKGKPTDNVKVQSPSNKEKNREKNQPLIDDKLKNQDKEQNTDKNAIHSQNPDKEKNDNPSDDDDQIKKEKIKLKTKYKKKNNNESNEQDKPNEDSFVDKKDPKANDNNRYQENENIPKNNNMISNPSSSLNPQNQNSKRDDFTGNKEQNNNLFIVQLKGKILELLSQIVKKVFLSGKFHTWRNNVNLIFLGDHGVVDFYYKIRRLIQKNLLRPMKKRFLEKLSKYRSKNYQKKSLANTVKIKKNFKNRMLNRLFNIWKRHVFSKHVITNQALRDLIIKRWTFIKHKKLLVYFFKWKMQETNKLKKFAKYKWINELLKSNPSPEAFEQISKILFMDESEVALTNALIGNEMKNIARLGKYFKIWSESRYEPVRRLSGLAEEKTEDQKLKDYIEMRWNFVKNRILYRNFLKWKNHHVIDIISNEKDQINRIEKFLKENLDSDLYEKIKRLNVEKQRSRLIERFLNNKDGIERFYLKEYFIRWFKSPQNIDEYLYDNSKNESYTYSNISQENENSEENGIYYEENRNSVKIIKNANIVLKDCIHKIWGKLSREALFAGFIKWKNQVDVVKAIEENEKRALLLKKSIISLAPQIQDQIELMFLEKRRDDLLLDLTEKKSKFERNILSKYFEKWKFTEKEHVVFKDFKNKRKSTFIMTNDYEVLLKKDRSEILREVVENKKEKDIKHSLLKGIEKWKKLNQVIKIEEKEKLFEEKLLEFVTENTPSKISQKIINEHQETQKQLLLNKLIRFKEEDQNRNLLKYILRWKELAHKIDRQEKISKRKKISFLKEILAHDYLELDEHQLLKNLIDRRWLKTSSIMLSKYLQKWRNNNEILRIQADDLKEVENFKDIIIQIEPSLQFDVDKLIKSVTLSDFLRKRLKKVDHETRSIFKSKLENWKKNSEDHHLHYLSTLFGVTDEDRNHHVKKIKTRFDLLSQHLIRHWNTQYSISLFLNFEKWKKIITMLSIHERNRKTLHNLQDIVNRRATVAKKSRISSLNNSIHRSAILKRFVLSKEKSNYESIAWYFNKWKKLEFKIRKTTMKIPQFFFENDEDNDAGEAQKKSLLDNHKSILNDLRNKSIILKHFDPKKSLLKQAIESLDNGYNDDQESDESVEYEEPKLAGYLFSANHCLRTIIDKIEGNNISRLLYKYFFSWKNRSRKMKLKEKLEKNKNKHKSVIESSLNPAQLKRLDLLIKNQEKVSKLIPLVNRCDHRTFIIFKGKFGKWKNNQIKIKRNENRKTMVNFHNHTKHNPFSIKKNRKDLLGTIVRLKINVDSQKSMYRAFDKWVEFVVEKQLEDQNKRELEELNQFIQENLKKEEARKLMELEKEVKKEILLSEILNKGDLHLRIKLLYAFLDWKKEILKEKIHERKSFMQMEKRRRTTMISIKTGREILKKCIEKENRFFTTNILSRSFYKWKNYNIEKKTAEEIRHDLDEYQQMLISTVPETMKDEINQLFVQEKREEDLIDIFKKKENIVHQKLQKYFFKWSKISGLDVRHHGHRKSRMTQIWKKLIDFNQIDQSKDVILGLEEINIMKELIERRTINENQRLLSKYFLKWNNNSEKKKIKENLISKNNEIDDFLKNNVPKNLYEKIMKLRKKEEQKNALQELLMKKFRNDQQLLRDKFSEWIDKKNKIQEELARKSIKYVLDDDDEIKVIQTSQNILKRLLESSWNNHSKNALYQSLFKWKNKIELINLFSEMKSTMDKIKENATQNANPDLKKRVEKIFIMEERENRLSDMLDKKRDENRKNLMKFFDRWNKISQSFNHIVFTEVKQRGTVLRLDEAFNPFSIIKDKYEIFKELIEKKENENSKIRLSKFLIRWRTKNKEINMVRRKTRLMSRIHDTVHEFGNQDEIKKIDAEINNTQRDYLLNHFIGKIDKYHNDSKGIYLRKWQIESKKELIEENLRTNLENNIEKYVEKSPTDLLKRIIWNLNQKKVNSDISNAFYKWNNLKDVVIVEKLMEEEVNKFTDIIQETSPELQFDVMKLLRQNSMEYFLRKRIYGVDLKTRISLKSRLQIWKENSVDHHQKFENRKSTLLLTRKSVLDPFSILINRCDLLKEYIEEKAAKEYNKFTKKAFLRWKKFFLISEIEDRNNKLISLLKDLVEEKASPEKRKTIIQLNNNNHRDIIMKKLLHSNEAKLNEKLINYFNKWKNIKINLNARKTRKSHFDKLNLALVAGNIIPVSYTFSAEQRLKNLGDKLDGSNNTKKLYKSLFDWKNIALKMKAKEKLANFKNKKKSVLDLNLSSNQRKKIEDLLIKQKKSELIKKFIKEKAHRNFLDFKKDFETWLNNIKREIREEKLEFSHITKSALAEPQSLKRDRNDILRDYFNFKYNLDSYRLIAKSFEKWKTLNQIGQQEEEVANQLKELDELVKQSVSSEVYKKILNSENEMKREEYLRNRVNKIHEKYIDKQRYYLVMWNKLSKKQLPRKSILKRESRRNTNLITIKKNIYNKLKQNIEKHWNSVYKKCMYKFFWKWKNLATVWKYQIRNKKSLLDIQRIVKENTDKKVEDEFLKLVRKLDIHESLTTLFDKKVYGINLALKSHFYHWKEYQESQKRNSERLNEIILPKIEELDRPIMTVKTNFSLLKSIVDRKFYENYMRLLEKYFYKWQRIKSESAKNEKKNKFLSRVEELLKQKMKKTDIEKIKKKKNKAHISNILKKSIEKMKRDYEVKFHKIFYRWNKLSTQLKHNEEKDLIKNTAFLLTRDGLMKMIIKKNWSIAKNGLLVVFFNLWKNNSKFTEAIEQDNKKVKDFQDIVLNHISGPAKKKFSELISQNMRRLDLIDIFERKEKGLRKLLRDDFNKWKNNAHRKRETVILGRRSIFPLQDTEEVFRKSKNQNLKDLIENHWEKDSKRELFIKFSKWKNIFLIIKRKTRNSMFLKEMMDFVEALPKDVSKDILKETLEIKKNDAVRDIFKKAEYFKGSRLRKYFLIWLSKKRTIEHNSHWNRNELPFNIDKTRTAFLKEFAEKKFKFSYKRSIYKYLLKWRYLKSVWKLNLKYKEKLDDLKEILESNIPEELRMQMNKLLKEEEKNHLIRVLFERKNFLLRERLRDMFEKWRKTQKVVMKRMKSISEAFWHKKRVVVPMNLARALKAKIERKTSQEYYLSIVRAFWKWRANIFNESIQKEIENWRNFLLAHANKDLIQKMKNYQEVNPDILKICKIFQGKNLIDPVQIFFNRWKAHADFEKIRQDKIVKSLPMRLIKKSIELKFRNESDKRLMRYFNIWRMQKVKIEHHHNYHLSKSEIHKLKGLEKILSLMDMKLANFAKTLEKKYVFLWYFNCQSKLRKFSRHALFNQILKGGHIIKKVINRNTFDILIDNTHLMNILVPDNISLKEALLYYTRGVSKHVAIKIILMRRLFNKWRAFKDNAVLQEIKSDFVKKISFKNKLYFIPLRNAFNIWKKKTDLGALKSLENKLIKKTFNFIHKNNNHRYLKIKFDEWKTAVNKANEASSRIKKGILLLEQTLLKNPYITFRRGIYEGDKYNNFERKFDKVMKRLFKRFEYSRLLKSFIKYKTRVFQSQSQQLKMKLIRSSVCNREIKNKLITLSKAPYYFQRWKIHTFSPPSYEGFNIKVGLRKLNHAMINPRLRPEYEKIKAKSQENKLKNQLKLFISNNRESKLRYALIHIHKLMLDRQKNQRHMHNIFMKKLTRKNSEFLRTSFVKSITDFKELVNQRNNSAKKIQNRYRTGKKAKRGLAVRIRLEKLFEYENTKLGIAFQKWLSKIKALDLQKAGSNLQGFIKKKFDSHRLTTLSDSIRNPVQVRVFRLLKRVSMSNLIMNKVMKALAKTSRNNIMEYLRMQLNLWKEIAEKIKLNARFKIIRAYHAYKIRKTLSLRSGKKGKSKKMLKMLSDKSLLLLATYLKKWVRFTHSDQVWNSGKIIQNFFKTALTVIPKIDMEKNTTRGLLNRKTEYNVTTYKSSFNGVQNSRKPKNSRSENSFKYLYLLPFIHSGLTKIFLARRKNTFECLNTKKRTKGFIDNLEKVKCLSSIEKKKNFFEKLKSKGGEFISGQFKSSLRVLFRKYVLFSLKTNLKPLTRVTQMINFIETTMIFSELNEDRFKSELLSRWKVYSIMKKNMQSTFQSNIHDLFGDKKKAALVAEFGHLRERLGRQSPEKTNKQYQKKVLRKYADEEDSEVQENPRTKYTSPTKKKENVILEGGSENSVFDFDSDDSQNNKDKKEKRASIINMIVKNQNKEKQVGNDVERKRSIREERKLKKYD